MGNGGEEGYGEIERVTTELLPVFLLLARLLKKSKLLLKRVFSVLLIRLLSRFGVFQRFSWSLGPKTNFYDKIPKFFLTNGVYGGV